MKKVLIGLSLLSVLGLYGPVAGGGDMAAGVGPGSLACPGAIANTFPHPLQGLVLQNDIPAGARDGTLNVLGQIVRITATTVFKSDIRGVTSPDQIARNHIVEVSGCSDGKGAIMATRLEVTKVFAYGDTIEVKGIVRHLTADTFDLGALTVDYTHARVPSYLADGLQVSVKSLKPPIGSTLIASLVDVEDNGSPAHQRFH